MAEEWFYTTHKQKMGPVSWKELIELAEVGILKPHDMVWTDGMDEWIKAINKKGLFTAGGDAEEAPVPKKKAGYTEAKPPPGRRTLPKEEDDDEDEGQEAKKANRKKQEDRARMAIGVKVGLTLGGVLLVLLFGGACVVGIIYVSISGGIGGGGNKAANPQAGELRPFTTNLSNPPPIRFWDERRTFQQGKPLVITTNVNGPNPNSRVVIHVLKGTNEVPNERPIIADDARPNNERNGRVEFVVPETDVYRIRIVNRGPGNVTVNVNIEER